jgi:hypothetical protein
MSTVKNGEDARKAVVLNKSYVENACVGEHRDKWTLGFCLRVTEKRKENFLRECSSKRDDNKQD